MTAHQLQAGPARILYDADRLTAVSFEWLDPDFWRMRQAVTSELGGRGQAIQVDTPAGPAVLRRYLRGGLVARLSHDRFVFTGHERSRSFREWHVLAVLRDRGLPVPEPLLAGCCRRGLLCQCALMTGLIADVRTLAEIGDELDESGWKSLGRTLARFFRAGVHHADLNAHNILLDGYGQWYLVDFDRARIARRPARPANMLARLFRSFDKLGIRSGRDVLRKTIAG